MGKINELTNAYKKVADAKCTEIMKPYLNHFDGLVKGLYKKFQNGEEITEEMTNELFGAYDNISSNCIVFPKDLWGKLRHIPFFFIFAALY